MNIDDSSSHLQLASMLHRRIIVALNSLIELDERRMTRKIRAPYLDLDLELELDTESAGMPK